MLPAIFDWTFTKNCTVIHMLLLFLRTAILQEQDHRTPSHRFCEYVALPLLLGHVFTYENG